MADEFKPGDLVELRSGSVRMAVAEFVPANADLLQGAGYLVIWEHKGVVKTRVLPAAVLQHVKPNA